MLDLSNPSLAPTARMRQAPPAMQGVAAIARREIGLAWRRKLPKLLFLISLVPPIVLIVILLVRLFAEQTTGLKLGWDPILRFLLIQSGPVALLALSLGTPLVARDRAEDVLFLYAVRPVLPWHYALGKLLAVALPAAALMLLPGVMIAGLRLTVTGDLNFTQASILVAKLAVAASLVSCAYAGIAVGASAGAKKARMALFFAVMVFVLPDALVKMARDFELPIGPHSAIERLITDLFKDRYGWETFAAAAALSAYAAAGFVLTTLRVKREMIP